MPAETMHEPTAPSIRSDEHDKVAKLQRELEKAQFDAQQKEEFGKYDVSVPGKGEGNYQEYIDSRPNDGIVRNGDVYQYADTGKFAGEAAYAAQNGTTEDHYDKVEKVSINGEQYQSMGVMQLAKEAAVARKDGNKAREGLIFEALEHHLTMDAMKDDSESPAEAQARYESEVQRYEDLVLKFAKIEHSKSEPPFPGTPTNAEAQNPTGEANANANPNTEPGTAETAPAASEATLNGEKVTIDNVFVSPDGQKVVQITGEDGKKQYVAESDLKFGAPDTSKENPLAPIVKDMATQRMKAKLQGEVEVLDDELKAQTANVEADPRVEQEREAARLAAEQELKFSERVKNWFQKEGKKIQEFGGSAYMGNLFKNGMDGIKNGTNRMLEWRIKEDMSPEEKDKIRKQNRYGAIAFAAAGAVIAGILIKDAIQIDSVDITEAVPTPEPTETVDQSIKDLLNPPGIDSDRAPGNFGPGMTIPDWDGPIGGGEAVPEAAAPEVVVPNEAFNIPAGGGGEQLFSDLKIDTNKWYANENTLLANFPNDFYRMESGHVGISRPGFLSQGAQDAINALK